MGLVGASLKNFETPRPCVEETAQCLVKRCIPECEQQVLGFLCLHCATDWYPGLSQPPFSHLPTEVHGGLCIKGCSCG